MSFFITFVIVGIIVVLGILVALIINLSGKSSHKNIENNIIAEKIESPVVETKFQEPIIEEGISEEVVAAISAAIYMITDGRPLIIKRIKKSLNTTNIRSAWGLAGSMDNTSPF